MRKNLRVTIFLFIIAFMFISIFDTANACSLFYFGGAYTDDGANLFMRIEDGEANDNKLYLVSPEGKYKAGEEYNGCYGFKWNFTHDSYRYIARMDDNIGMVCPNCGKDHLHQPYQEAGTNEYGLTVTCTNSVDANIKISEVDPYIENGVSEAEMATILLSECSSASDAIDFLKRLVETEGMCREGFSIMLCDQNEQWYVEAIASHYFLAIPLSENLIFLNVNVSSIGLIDLDDENIICTDGLIELAQKAGTFIGDEDENIIDYRRSISDYKVDLFGDNWKWNVFERNAVYLNNLLKTDKYNADNVLEEDNYIITNISEDGSIVPFYNDLNMNDTVNLDYLLELLRLYPIGSTQNVETHIYRFYPNVDLDFGIIEYSSFSDNEYNVFIPSYPVLMTDTWDGYKVGLSNTIYESKDPDFWDEYEEVINIEVEPLEEEIIDTNDYYIMSGVNYMGYDFIDSTGQDLYCIFPKGWDKSYCYTFNGTSNYLYYMGTDKEKELAIRYYNYMQQDYNSRFEELSADLMKETDPLKRQEMMTREHAAMSRESQESTLALYRHFRYGEELPDGFEDQGFDMKYAVIALCGALALCGIMYKMIKITHHL
ncbi:MAG: C69 family dipeptidase [Butyrivibrio sp.]|uniref:C69 family dipeptidase n=1 Tax=Butyrivibrio sp. TaxID=28121 RepID=UPI0025CC55C2|nr:C69 family dipeptidase [Butyrivibrio sp.]MCR5772433.1 C69 family dipeptidase [Butyrivibrio sp.]